MLLRFTKMHGLGNDFVVLDAISQDVKLNSTQIQSIANRRTGVGCDQLLLIEPPSNPDIDFNYRIFNANGSEVEQCGNGARCLGKFVFDKKLTGKRKIRVATCNTVMHIEMLERNQIKVNMGPPILQPSAIPLTEEQQQTSYTLNTDYGDVEFGAVSMGNPHAVILVDNIDSAEVDTLGPAIENHAAFPNRVNVGFMQIVDQSTVRLRVYERGVGETQACGTGACAAMVSGKVRGLLSDKVDVQLTGGNLQIEWAGADAPVYMTGKAVKVFDGKIRL